MPGPVEFDLRSQDTFLAVSSDPTQTTLTLGHDAGSTFVTYPATPFWVVIEPDDPNAREDVLVTALAGPVATVRRGFTASPPATGVAHRVGVPVRLATRAGAIVEPFHVVGAAGEPAFVNGWTNLGGAFATAAFCRTPDGLVLLRGRIAPGAATPVFTLPAGYRPSGGTLSFTSDVGGGFRIDVLTSGVVQALGAPGSSALDCARFPAGG